MKGFFKFLGSVAAIFIGAVGALSIYDRYKNKNRIKGDYLECDCEQDENDEN